MKEIQPVCFLQLPYSMWHPTRSRPFFFLFFFLSFFFSVSLSFLWQISFEQCHTLEELFSDNLSDNHLLHSVPWPRHHRAISITLKRNWKDTNAKWRGNACTWEENDRTWMHIGMKMEGIWKEHEGKLRNDSNERNMKGTWMKGNECKMKGTCMQMNAKWNLKGTWSVAEAPETNKTTPRSISEPVKEWILASCWISNNYADFHKTLESAWPLPRAITITIATTQMYQPQSFWGTKWTWRKKVWGTKKKRRNSTGIQINPLVLAQGKEVGTIATMLLELALCRCTDPPQPPPTLICRFRDFCGLTKQTAGTYRISSRCWG